jgi:cell division protein FtsB
MRVIQSPNVRKLAGPFCVAFGIFYFIFHTLAGEHGLYALFRENRKLEVLQTELIQVGAERKALEHRVNLLSNSSIDRDLLDEQSRSVLGFAAPGEKMIPIAPEPSAK